MAKTMMRDRVPQWNLGDRLGKALQVSGVSVQEMADELDVSRQSVGNYIAGRTTPQRATVLLWAAITGVDAGWLLHGDDQENQSTPWTTEQPAKAA